MQTNRTRLERPERAAGVMAQRGSSSRDPPVRQQSTGEIESARCVYEGEAGGIRRLLCKQKRLRDEGRWQRDGQQ